MEISNQELQTVQRVAIAETEINAIKTYIYPQLKEIKDLIESNSKLRKEESDALKSTVQHAIEENSRRDRELNNQMISNLTTQFVEVLKDQKKTNETVFTWQGAVKVIGTLIVLFLGALLGAYFRGSIKVQ